tara:strand:- start:19777 stop:20520 length:744 start_codon:yes stop_codon:yes gene_type:complete
VEIIERKEALEAGLIRYFTGALCIKGHVDERETNSGQCLSCKRERTRAWRKRPDKDKYNETYNKGKPLPSVEYLKSILKYEPETGCLFWKPREESAFDSKRSYSYFKTRYEGVLAGHLAGNGYTDLRIDKRLMKAHRVIWKMVYGEDPPYGIDHINGDRSDNRINNLRLATPQENARNTIKWAESGYKGVIHKGNCYSASWTINDSGCKESGFGSAVEAAKFYDKMVYKEFGEFAKLNFPEDYEEEL